MNHNPPTHLLLIRHGEVEEPYQHVFGGRLDMDLSPLGHKQARELASYLHTQTVDTVFASPMKRVQQTLAPFLGNGAPQARILDDLCEVDFGDWTGHGWAAVQEKFGVSAYSWIQQLQSGAINGAEDIDQYRSRVGRALQEIIPAKPGGQVAVFCHGGVIRMMLALLLDLPFGKTDSFAVDYASVTDVALKPDRAEIQLLNFTPWRTDRL